MMIECWKDDQGYRLAIAGEDYEFTTGGFNAFADFIEKSVDLIRKVTITGSVTLIYPKRTTMNKFYRSGIIDGALATALVITVARVLVLIVAGK